jgi:hypothetical protein
MSFIKYIFGFLYERNWHTGERQISYTRLSLFSALVFLIVLGLFLVWLMQLPVEYSASE